MRRLLLLAAVLIACMNSGCQSSSELDSYANASAIRRDGRALLTTRPADVEWSTHRTANADQPQNQ